MVHSDQVDSAGIQSPLHQVVISAECDSVGLGIDLRDIASVSGRNSEPPALAERIVDDPLVAPQDIALRIHEIAGSTLRAAVALDKAGVVAVRNKADILAVVLLGIPKTALRGEIQIMEKEQFLEVYRHSLAHILAKAVIEIYGKEVQYAIGPQIADGCYYDFVLPVAITEGDFPAIENKMREIIKRRETWTMEEVSKEKALEIFKDQKFKTELICDLPEDEKITVYYTGDDFVDLCRGPHIDNSQLLMNVAFQVKSVSGAYWRGDEHRDQMQRVYLYAFPDQKQLKEHLKMIKEAMERDHKKLGPQLELFMFNETAQGMPYWLPRGWKLYQALMQYSRDVQDLHEYQEISAPVINNNKLWIISGHWAHYVNNMFIIPGKDEDEKYTVESTGISSS